MNERDIDIDETTTLSDVFLDKSARVRSVVASFLCIAMILIEVTASFNFLEFFPQDVFDTLLRPNRPFLWAWMIITAGVIYKHYKKELSETFICYWSIVAWNLNLFPVYYSAFMYPDISCTMALDSAYPYTLPAAAAAVIGPTAGVLQGCMSVIFVGSMCSGSRGYGTRQLLSNHYVSIFVVLGSIWLNAKLRSIQTNRIDFIKANAELLAAKKTAESESKYKTDFISRMSHELKTPLSVLTSSTEYLINQKQTLAEAAIDHWHQVQLESCRLLKNLLDNVLVLHRIEAGQQKLTKDVFSMHTVAKEAHKMLTVSSNLKSIDFSVYVDDHVAGEHVGDPVRVGQIIMNLASNAIRFCDSGYVHVYVDALEMVHGDGDGDKQRLQIRVEDSGVGMTFEQQESVLNPNATVVPERGGCGLGLRIVHHLCESMEGSLSLECEGVGFGTTFYAEIVLPVASKDQSAALKQSLSHESDEFVEERRVLVVEDNRHIQSLIELHLNDAGHTVTLADNGQEGLDKFTKSVDPSNPDPFDIILMDLRMPVMGGLEATQSIREVEASRGIDRIPIIALTAHSLRSELMECFSAGCSGYVQKPVDMNHLLDCVETLGESTTKESSLLSPFESPAASPSLPRHVLH